MDDTKSSPLPSTLSEAEAYLAVLSTRTILDRFSTSPYLRDTALEYSLVSDDLSAELDGETMLATLCNLSADDIFDIHDVINTHAEQPPVIQWDDMNAGYEDPEHYITAKEAKALSKLYNKSNIGESLWGQAILGLPKAVVDDLLVVLKKHETAKRKKEHAKKRRDQKYRRSSNPLAKPAELTNSVHANPPARINAAMGTETKTKIEVFPSATANAASASATNGKSDTKKLAAKERKKRRKEMKRKKDAAAREAVQVQNSTTDKLESKPDETESKSKTANVSQKKRTQQHLKARKGQPEAEAQTTEVHEDNDEDADADDDDEMIADSVNAIHDMRKTKAEYDDRTADDEQHGNYDATTKRRKRKSNADEQNVDDRGRKIRKQSQEGDEESNDSINRHPTEVIEQNVKDFSNDSVIKHDERKQKHIEDDDTTIDNQRADADEDEHPALSTSVDSTQVRNIAAELPSGNLVSLSPRRVESFPAPTLPASTGTPVRRTSPRKTSTPLKSPFFPASSSTTPSTSPRKAGTSCIPFPPLSAKSFGLIQERLADNPFHLLIAVYFLNKTRGSVALPVIFQILENYPTPADLAEAKIEDIVPVIRHLGLQNQRAKKLVDMAKMWLEAPPTRGKRHRTIDYPYKGAGKGIKPAELLEDEDDICKDELSPAGEGQSRRIGAWEIAHLPGVGAYALDSWRIFCRDTLRGVATGWNGECVEQVSDEPSDQSSEFTSDKDGSISLLRQESITNDSDTKRNIQSKKRQAAHPVIPSSETDERSETESDTDSEAASTSSTPQPLPIQEDEIASQPSGAREHGVAKFQPEWERVLPFDKELRAFLRWMWLKQYGLNWNPLTGNKTKATEEMLRKAEKGNLVVDELDTVDGVTAST